MPTAALSHCRHCGVIGCQQHGRTTWAQTQPPTRIRGRRLQRLRAELFAAHPMCATCKTALAEIRDHIVPLAEGGQDEETNVQGLCQDCSDRKSQAEAARGRHRGGGSS